MIANRCEKCKNIGCNNDNFICNNWSEEKRNQYSDNYKNATDLEKVTNVSNEVCHGLFRSLERMVKRTPNDMELGALIRDFFKDEV